MKTKNPLQVIAATLVLVIAVGMYQLSPEPTRIASEAQGVQTQTTEEAGLPQLGQSPAEKRLVAMGWDPKGFTLQPTSVNTKKTVN